jgi:hypothetical protein
MKALWVAIICSCAMASASRAASVTVPDNSTALPGAAAATAALLIDAGLPVQNIGGGKFVVEAKDFHCDQHSNAPLDASNPRAGLPDLKCRISAQNKRNTTTGRPFGDRHAMVDLLQRIANSNAGAGLQFVDCAMQYCGTFVKSIKCTINTAIENFNNGGRWACTFTDGQ